MAASRSLLKSPVRITPDCKWRVILSRQSNVWDIITWLVISRRRVVDDSDNDVWQHPQHPSLLYSSRTDLTFGDSNSAIRWHGTGFRFQPGFSYTGYINVITTQHYFQFVGFLSRSATNISIENIRQKIFTYWNVYSYRRPQIALPVTIHQMVVDNCGYLPRTGDF